MKRLFAGAIIIFLTTTVSPWLLLPFVLLHAFAWFAVELVVIAALIDAYFGILHPVPYYTLAAVVIVVLAEWLKPQLSMYADK